MQVVYAMDIKSINETNSNQASFFFVQKYAKKIKRATNISGKEIKDKN